MRLAADQAWEVLNSAELVCSASDAVSAVERVAREVADTLRDRNPVVLGVMRGCVVFAGRLLPLFAFPLEFDYLDVRRYRDTTRGGAIDWKVSPGTAVAGRVVLVLDDILDEGYTLAAVRDEILAAGAQAFYSAVFADKDIGVAKPIAADFVGIRVPNRYVFGFGMDVKGAWRNLPAVYALKEHNPPS
ncbi:MAG: hypoxanthine-guanine phosphoribosyltransferase [Betaproteobacteria bacterium]